MAAQKPDSLGGLKSAGYRTKPVREEVHANLVRKISAGEELFPGIVGYQHTVIPELENALLAGHNVIILGERGQAKSRLVRALTSLLDPEVPVIAGSELNDDPFVPVSPNAVKTVAELGEKTPISWIGRDQRYSEKLATPDVSMADLIGDVDPIKVAEGRYLADDLTIHYGLIPRTNRGIFCVNELPDLPERIQVALFNLMQERDIQIKGYRIRLPLDMLLFATANPEDYTNRGRIITPLKDRFGAQIRTHYPLTLADEQAIVEQEKSKVVSAEVKVTILQFMSDIVAEISSQARQSSEINQRSGVSVRVSIANYETLHSSALKRALRLRETTGSPRITDLPAIISSMRGKIELETTEDGQESSVIDELTKRSIAAVFEARYQPAELDALVGMFDDGITLHTGAGQPSADYVRLVESVRGLKAAIGRLKPATQAEVASAVEFVLEGLHLHRRLNRQKVGPAYSYVKKPQPPPAQSLQAEPGDIRHRRKDAGQR